MKNVVIEISGGNRCGLLLSRGVILVVSLTFLSAWFWPPNDDYLDWVIKPVFTILGVWSLVYVIRFSKHHKRCYFSLDAQGLSARCKLPTIPLLPDGASLWVGFLFSFLINTLAEPDYVELDVDWGSIKEIRILKDEIRITLKTNAMTVLPIEKLLYSQRQELESTLKEFAFGSLGAKLV